jgi:pantetheine-phosphate adenylyltransferase
MTQPRLDVVAIYPGSFDPITSGHLDVIERGSKMFSRVIVAILQNEAKQPLFTIAERMEMLRESLGGISGVEIGTFKGLLADYAVARNASVILRGIRAISDYEYELQMAHMNRRLRPGLETVFLPAGEMFSFISSRMVKEVISLGGNIKGLVPQPVEEHLRRRIGQQQKGTTDD